MREKNYVSKAFQCCNSKSDNINKIKKINKKKCFSKLVQNNIMERNTKKLDQHAEFDY